MSVHQLQVRSLAIRLAVLASTGFAVPNFIILLALRGVDGHSIAGAVFTSAVGTLLFGITMFLSVTRNFTGVSERIQVSDPRRFRHQVQAQLRRYSYRPHSISSETMEFRKFGSFKMRYPPLRLETDGAEGMRVDGPKYLAKICVRVARRGRTGTTTQTSRTPYCPAAPKTRYRSPSNRKPNVVVPYAAPGRCATA